MSTVALRHLSIGALFVLLCTALHAQPNVEVYWDDGNRADTVMDFGVTLEGYPVTVPFYVRNMGPTEVGILVTNPNTEPYYQIVNTPDVEPAHPRKEEFERVEDLPYRIAAFSVDTFHVSYKAVKNNPLFPPDSVTKAFLELRVISMNDSLGTAFFKRFLMIALKTKFSVASNKPVIRFDSVYVNPVPQPPSEVYTVVNASSLAIPVEQQKLVYMTSVVGDRELIVDTLSSPLLAPKQGLTWNTRYQPHNMGFDSAQFVVVYRPNQGSDVDSVVTRLSGVGVKQELRVDSANGLPPPVIVKQGVVADTIDFGDVDADGSGGKLARIVLKNSGNIHVRYVSEREEGTALDTTAFIVERSLMTGGLDLRTNERDTLLVRFKPVVGGLHIEQYVIGTDLLVRPVRGVPDGAEQKILVLKAFARKPQMSYSPQQVNFGSVVLLEDCPSAVERQVLVRNTGNILLRIDSVRIEPAGAAVAVTPQEPIPPISVDSTLPLVLRYQPTVVETLAAELVLYTNAFGPPVRIPLSGSSVPSDSIAVNIPHVQAKPGTVLHVPVHVEGDNVSLAQTSSISVAFDPTLLRYRGAITGGTASEGSTLIVDAESPRGLLTLQLRALGSFLKRDTFVVITFDTYLGKSAATELSIKDQTTLFGNDGCSNIFTVLATSGSFTVDSVCGLPYKTATTGVLRLGVWPNPTSDYLYVHVDSPTSEVYMTRLFDAYGAELPCEYDVTTNRLSLLALPSGMYVVAVECGGQVVYSTVIRQ